jgi:exodeoxyribonuclease VII small subunit
MPAVSQMPNRAPSNGPARKERAVSGEGRAAFDPELSGVSGPIESLTFEELVAALERVAARLAGGELGIEAAVELYEQAELLHEAAQERLAAVEARIERLSPPDQA